MDSEVHAGKRRKAQLPSMISINEAQYEIFQQEYAERYMMKLKSRLDKSSFSRIVSILLEIGQKEANIINIFKDISHILQFYPDLEEEFLTFLYPTQAAECGRLIDYLQLSYIKEFLFKLNLCFKENAQQIRKIMNAISRLTLGTNVTTDLVRTTILPLLKSNSFLIDSFLRLIPQEKPPESLFSDNWEEIDIHSTEPVTDEVIYFPKSKNRSLDGTDDNNYLNCTNHKSDVCQSTRNVINFANGKLFIPHGKIKPGKIMTENISIDHTSPTMRFSQKEDTLKHGRGNKKLIATNNDSACTESDDDITIENARLKRKREGKNLCLPLFKRSKYDRSFKNESLCSKNRNDSIVPKKNIISKQVPVCNDQNTINKMLACFDDNATSELFISANQDIINENVTCVGINRN